jgi:hypothetical protein
MTFSARTRYLLITAAIVTASAIQLVRGYRPLIVIVGAVAFLIAGNLIVYLSGSKARAIRLQRKRDYYAGKS